MMSIGKLAHTAMTVIYVVSKHKDGIKSYEIAEESGLAHGTLTGILAAIKRFGILDSIKGIHGGYQLSKNALDFTVTDVYCRLASGLTKAKRPRMLDGVDTSVSALCTLLNETTLKEYFELMAIIEE